MRFSARCRVGEGACRVITATELCVELPCEPPLDGVFFVDGRCLKGALTIGTELDVRFRYVVVAGATSAPVAEERVHLSVRRIEIYGRTVSELPEGWTARVHLHGHGVKLRPLSPGDVLGALIRQR